MRFLHLGDLHLGKIINNFPMLEDQRYILNQIMEHVKEQKPDAVILAGDIYDRSVPPAAAVSLYNDFLKALLIDEKVPVLAVAGNHDGADMIHFGHQLFESANYFVAGHYTTTLRKVTMHDEWGPVNFYLLPFADHAVVREALGNKDIKTLEDACLATMDTNPLDPGSRNILITHHYVSGGTQALEQSDSEKRLVIGGKETVAASIFEGFNYVALGHLHRQQPVQTSKIRYSGSILKYSFSEENDSKSITLVELDEKGEITTSHLPLKPQRDVRTLKGSLQELLTNPQGFKEDYLRVILTDEGELIEPMAKLREVYPHIMSLSLERDLSERFKAREAFDAPVAKSTIELFSEFYQHQREQPLSEQGRMAMEKILKAVEEG